MFEIDRILCDLDTANSFGNKNDPPFKKPPLGIKPRKFVVEERAIEIAEAVIRFIKAGRAPYTEWVDELKELANYLSRIDCSSAKEMPKFCDIEPLRCND